MPAIQAIPRLPIDFSANDAKSMRAGGSFQNQFDQQLESSRSKVEKSDDSSRSDENKSRGREVDQKSESEEFDSIDQSQNVKDVNQSDESQAEDSLKASEATDDETTSISDSNTESGKEDQNESMEVDAALLIESTQLATIPNQTSSQIEESLESDTTQSVQNQPMTIKSISQSVASSTVTEVAKQVEATKQAEKSDGQIELPEFKAVKSTDETDVDDSKHESRDHSNKSFDEVLSKQQTKFDGEVAKPSVEQVKPEQSDPTRLTIDSIQSKSTESATKPTPNLQLASRDPEVARNNVENIVSSVRAQLLPRGGNMQMRLDPPELGALTISLKLVDGRMTASFTTENSEATRMLSNNLAQLKSTLEASGVQVHRLDVKTSSETFSNTRDEENRNQQKQSDGSWQQSEQQRREMVNRMWRRYAYGSDELDLVA